MIELHITMTGKSYAPKEPFRRFAEDVKRFPSLPAAKAWIKEQYGNAKRSPMYVDTPIGSKRIGYVIGFRASDCSHVPVEHWIQNDWIEFRECKPLSLDESNESGTSD